MMILPAPKLHIVSFDVPYPADYGGAIDVFYKIKSLSEAGCEIYLHCFAYGRLRTTILEQYCKQVWYYPRLVGWRGISWRYPYIVYSRRNKQLKARLAAIEAPVLFEGVHTSFYADHPALKGRLKLLRTHNVEHEYYRLLSSREPAFFSKAFFQTEAVRLKIYEAKLGSIDVFLELSLADKRYFEQAYRRAAHFFVAPFHPFHIDDIPEGSGSYCLYHGNLSHPENIEAAMFLLQQVIPSLKIPFIIAGRKPDLRIVQAAQGLPNCSLISDPNEQTMKELVANAHIHVLPTFQPSGMKLKLLYALFGGRHVVVNNSMLSGTGLDDLCHIAESGSAFIAVIESLMNKSFAEEERMRRATVLDKDYNNRVNAANVLTFLRQKSP